MLQKIVYNSNDDEIKFEGQPDLAMKFESQITKIKFVSGKYLLGISEDTSCQLMDLESK